MSNLILKCIKNLSEYFHKEDKNNSQQVYETLDHQLWGKMPLFGWLLDNTHTQVHTKDS